MIEEPILLVEDSPDDRELMLLAMKRAKVTNPVRSVANGRDAIRYLSGDGEYADRTKFPLPFLILLDLKLPEVTGLDVLQWIRAHLDFPVIVIILSSSAQPQDVVLAAKRHCNSYLVKPDSMDDLYALVQLIKTYWIEQNQWRRGAP